MPKKLKLFAWVDEQDVAHLREIARREHLPTSEIIRKAVRQYLAGVPEAPPKLSVDESLWLNAWIELRTGAPELAAAVAVVVRELVAHDPDTPGGRRGRPRRGRGRRNDPDERP